MKKLSEYLNDYYQFSGKASDINRQLGFAGVAIIWIFKNDSTTHMFPSDLLLPLLLLLASLAADFLQYVLASMIWRYFFNKEWKKKPDANKEVAAPEIYNRVINAFWMIKIALLMLAYCFLFLFLLGKV